ncbi:MAG: coproporphyrinogen III oxidase, partial [Salana multivorans]|nr:coproporphyrinogen III oxidase [Salana multivorans]
GGVRWWNVKHPRAYAGRLAAGRSPAAAREILDDDARVLEDVLLGTRLADGYELARLRPAARAEVAGLVRDGLATLDPADGGRLRLTLRGRLLADTVVHRLTA